MTIKELRDLLNKEIKKGNGKLPVVQAELVREDENDPEDYGHVEFYSVDGIYTYKNNEYYQDHMRFKTKLNKIHIKK